MDTKKVLLQWFYNFVDKKLSGGNITGGVIMQNQQLTEVTSTVPIKAISANAAPTNFYDLLPFLLITIALLIAVSFYCYLIKCRAKQNHLLPYYDTSNKLKEIDMNNIMKK